MSADLVARALAVRARARTTIAVGVLGQSNERGQVDPTEAIGGIKSITAHPQAFVSQRNPSIRYPIGPATAKYGGMWFKLYDDLFDWGYDTQIVNGAVGGASMLRDICGQVQARAHATEYRQFRAPAGLGDNGYAGDYMVAQGRVFLCTRGNLIYATSNTGLLNAFTGGNEFDYVRVAGPVDPAARVVSAGSEPAGLASATVGQVIVDGGIEWTCLSTSTAWLGATYVAGQQMPEGRPGFDPLGLCKRLLIDLQRVRDARRRIVLLANAQSDIGTDKVQYGNALNVIASFFLQRGVSVAIGLSFYMPTGAYTATYDQLTTQVNAHLTGLRNSASDYYRAADVIAGANLYTALGSTGNMAAAGAYLAKDSGQDNIHVNARGAIAGGAAWADALKAVLPRQM